MHSLVEVLQACEDKLSYIVSANKSLSVLAFNNPTDPILQTINSSINPIIYNLKKLSFNKVSMFKTFYLYEDYTYIQKIFSLNQVLEGVIFFLKTYLNFNPFQKMLNSKKYTTTFSTFVTDLDSKSRDLLRDIPIIKYARENHEILEWSYTVGSQLTFKNDTNRLRLVISKVFDHSELTVNHYQTEILIACNEDCCGKCENCFVENLSEETRFYLSILDSQELYNSKDNKNEAKDCFVQDEVDITLTDMSLSG